MNKQTIAQAIEGIERGYSSIYSKDDVFEILKSIEEPMPSTINNVLKSSLKIIINNTIAHVRRQIIYADLDNGSEYFENDSARFHISGNELSVDHIDADWDKIKSEVEYFIDEQLECMTDYVIEHIIPTTKMNVIDDMKEAVEDAEY
jgi:hypothetical protein